MSLNIDITKVKEAVLDRYTAQHGIAVRGGLTAKVNAVEAHQMKNTAQSDISTPCSECGGSSDFNLPECPYCGAKDAPAPNDVPNSMEVLANDALHDRHIAATAEPLEATADAPATIAPTTEVAFEAPPTQEEPAMKKKTKLVKVKGSGAVVETSGHELASTTELDAAVGRVHASLRNGATSYWELGQALLEIFEKNLWKQRIEGGRQKFPSWNLFCRDELEMSHTNTFGIMDAAKAFSKKDFEDIGHTRLTLMLRLPKERQQLLREEARAGRLPRARLKEIVEQEVPKGARRETGRNRANNPNLAAAGNKAAEKNREKAAARRVAPKPDGEITAVSQLGRVKLKMLARPNVKKPNEKPSRAISLTQDPWCEEQLINGVIVRYTVVKTATGIELQIERRRAD